MQFTLVVVAIAEMKHQDQKNLERKVFILFTFPYDCSSLAEARTGSKTTQEPGG